MLQDLYSNSPYYLQTLLLNLYAAKIHKQRYGKQFKSVFSELEKTQYYSKDQILEYQTRKFLNIVRHAYETVPFYNQLFNENGIKPSDIQSLEDANKIPLLTKDDVKNNFNEMISSRFTRKDLVLGGTSGTTGTPLKVLWDRNTCIYTNAVDWRQKAWGGIFFGDKVAQLLGRPIVSPNRKKKPFWQMDHIHNQLWMSSFHLSDENIIHYIEKLSSYNPVAIEGYPSTLYILSEYMNRNNIVLPMKAAFSSSETLLPFQKEEIQKAFSCNLYDFYGLAERTVFATECEFHDGKHLNFEYGYTEIVNDSGNNVDEGEKGYLVSTSLQNYGMPLIRYKTTDITRFKSDACKCGRYITRIENITTKAEDIIVTPEGKMISSSILTHPFKMANGIKKSQIIQEQKNYITLKLVTDERFNKNEENALLESIRYRIGDNIEITIEQVKDIPRTKSGKYRWVISKVPKGQLNKDIE
jgi:phenylacetate-CoA ligase